MKKLLPILFSILVFSGCASIIHGPYQDIDFSSAPSGAKITIDGVILGNTPQTISLKRKGYRQIENLRKKKGYNVKIEMPGYFPYEMTLHREMDTWFAGNVLFFIGGIVGIAIDATTGSMYKLSPNQVIAHMARDNEQAGLTKEDSISIFVTLKADPSWEKVGQLKAN